MNLEFENWLSHKKNIEVLKDVLQYSDLLAFIDNVKSLLFPGYGEYFNNLSNYLDEKIENASKYLIKLLRTIEILEKIDLDEKKIVNDFFNKLPEIDELLKTDIEALFKGDPAAKSITEIIMCYPGLTAIYIYRVAHVLYELNIPILPRALSEYAHSKTGIDIHPGAKIDSYFFIDHGTGIVIGETTEIGKNVKIYQGVTLGALSLSKGQSLSGTKRHPTIMDNVTIYSGASIFGGDTIIGRNTTIGSNAFITSSVEDDMVVSILGQNKKRK